MLFRKVSGIKLGFAMVLILGEGIGYQDGFGMSASTSLNPTYGTAYPVAFNLNQFEGQGHPGGRPRGG